MAALAAELGVRHLPEGFVAFGAPIGSDAFVTETLAKRADTIVAEVTYNEGIVAEVERLMELPLHRQSQWQLLRASLSLRLEHLKRSVPWELLADSTRCVERAIEEAAAAIFALPEEPPGVASPARQQLSLPMRHGGFGLRRTDAAAADAALLAGAASAQTALAAAPACLQPLADGSASRAELLPRWQALHDAHAGNCGWDDAARDLPAGFVREQLPAAAHDLGRKLGDARGQAFLAACDLDTADGRRAAARLRSAAGSAASAFLTAMPCVPTTRLADRDFVSGGRHRLGLGLHTAVEIPPCTCRAGEAAVPDHAMTCDHCKPDSNMRSRNRC